MFIGLIRIRNDSKIPVPGKPLPVSYRLTVDLIADMYENAHKQDPSNEEHLSALFMAYVRIHEYKKQQQTAVKLHKLRPEKNPYYFWTVMSIVMQVCGLRYLRAMTTFVI